MKIVINRCYGGFGLSDAVYEKLIEKGWTTTTYNSKGNCENPDADIVVADERLKSFRSYNFTSSRGDESIRTNKDIIEVVEEIGELANSRYSKLSIVEIPDDVKWNIEEYDGLEWVAEEHRTWR